MYFLCIIITLPEVSDTSHLLYATENRESFDVSASNESVNQVSEQDLVRKLVGSRERCCSMAEGSSTCGRG